MPLADASQAHELLESRQATGKILLNPWSVDVSASAEPFEFKSPFHNPPHVIAGKGLNE